MRQLKFIAGDITVRPNCGGYIARHIGKTASCTGSEAMAAVHVLEKVYGKDAVYYLSLPTYHGSGNTIYQAVSARKAERK